jgi:hypothetical protein
MGLVMLLMVGGVVAYLCQIPESQRQLQAPTVKPIKLPTIAERNAAIEAKFIDKLEDVGPDTLHLVIPEFRSYAPDRANVG